MLQPVVVNGVEKPCAVEFGLDSAGQERIVRAGISDGVFSIEDEHLLTAGQNIAYTLHVIGLQDKESAIFTDSQEGAIEARRRKAVAKLGAGMLDALYKSFALDTGIFSIEATASVP